MKLIRKEKTQAAQVYFPKSVYFEIKLRARRENKATAEWIRDAALYKLVKGNVKKGARKKMKSFTGFSFPGIDPNISDNIDKIVYDL